MDTAQIWPQEIGLVKSTDQDHEMVALNNTCSNKAMLERKVRPEKEQALNCPRCNSTNTKFCYYNNYSLTQPRYFCKTCRRYWTEGGTLRNVPVGGGSRKNKRYNSTTISSSSTLKAPPDLNPPNPNHFSSQNTPEGQQFLKLPKIENNNTCSSWQVSALELLKSGIGCSTHGLSSFVSTSVPMLNTNALYTPVFPLHEFKPSLSFCGEGINGSFQENGGRFMFPFRSLKDQFPSSGASEVDQNRGQDGNYSGGQYWNGMFGGR